jgi:hypothetical protein
MPRVRGKAALPTVAATAEKKQIGRQLFADPFSSVMSRTPIARFSQRYPDQMLV